MHKQRIPAVIGWNS